MPRKGGEIEVEGCSPRVWAGIDPSGTKEATWAERTRRAQPPKKDEAKSRKPPPQPIEDDDVEDGDIATPKRDRNDKDDEPL